MNAWALVQFAGGIGLFLLGMKTMTEGLRTAAGETLRAILAAATSSRWRGLASGILITAAVQSSSAVIFATIGFVNAGLISLVQAVGIIHGASIGTSLTSWVVAAVGFDINLRALALPFIAIGMALRIVAGQARLGALGEAVAGLGLFLLGLDILKGTFAGLGQDVELAAFAGTGLPSLLLFVGIGFLLTTLMQSSSAAMAVTITAAVGGVIPLHAAATLVLGAVLGTCTTAAFAGLVATAAGKRAASSHVLLNALTVVVGFTLMPVLLPMATWTGGLIGGDANVGVVLALFHSLVVILGVAVMWPLTGWVVRQLERRFTGRAARPERPEFLDRNVLETPVMAIDALALEVGRVSAMSRTALAGVVTHSAREGADVDAQRAEIVQLVTAINELASELGRRGGISTEIQNRVARALRVTQYLLDVTERAVEFRRLAGRSEISDAHLQRLAERYIDEVTEFVGTSDPMASGFDAQAVESAATALEERYQALKGELLRAVVEGRIGPDRLSSVLDRFSALRRSVDQLRKVAGLGEVLQTGGGAMPAPANDPA